MLKRFLIGFALGVGGMYWYIHHAERMVSDTNSWIERSAAHYRGDSAHESVDQATGGKAR